jgi:hypothetical protein
LLHIELDGLPFLQAAESLHSDFRLMTEQVLPPVAGRDEPVTLGVIKPFDFAFHDLPLFSSEELSTVPVPATAPPAGRRAVQRQFEFPNKVPCNVHSTASQQEKKHPNLDAAPILEIFPFSDGHIRSAITLHGGVEEKRRASLGPARCEDELLRVQVFLGL